MALNPRILIVAGTDPTGGAGIVRDIETAAHMRVDASIAITSVNVQDDMCVSQKHPISGEIIAHQMSAVLQAQKIDAIKIGMTGTSDSIDAITQILTAYPVVPVIFDPVIMASSGGYLVDNACIDAIKAKLLKHCYCVTPNLFELSRLSNSELAENELIAIEQAKNIFNFGVPNILIKGGHAAGKTSNDILLNTSTQKIFTNPRINTSMRGTGCILSTAIACHIALGKHLNTAIEEAKNYVFHLLEKNKKCKI
ncbi:bifunctional hydroxymethylpyrimidine kinase/phosphomethylpyrimidine kinase [Bartonella tamiae]|uniref:hydroxymethylpyrimidine kinase n=1 Tax=Bartonella tamiae Th239 TaxID=1094558 RepID=J0QX38_9HYPH|nr:hydroxymethylpyrimidine/phosphomethylpyrimidine kinase [Bartonella tamiae]EJF90606.1 phosphomethylpyrimidine kinase [Bartonella tamiae Th239]EJF94016.1 phosphomethylpyrimidine kinase [Bartonella tamiae Th307]